MSVTFHFYFREFFFFFFAPFQYHCYILASLFSIHLIICHFFQGLTVYTETERNKHASDTDFNWCHQSPQLIDNRELWICMMDGFSNGKTSSIASSPQSLSGPLRGVELGGPMDNKFEAYAHMNEIGIFRPC